ncbi:MAG: hypothetical protein M3Y87_25495 [Myxococcota bacterium]|nr:hypothetical protein [Myxococcota bacterium]
MALPPRREGAPSFGAVSLASKWTVGVGRELAIDVMVKNIGGAARGVWVELGGPAASSVELCGAALDDETAAVDGARASIPKASVAAGFDYVRKRGEPPPPDESRTLRIVVRATSAGSALFTIRVGPGNGETTSGSALVGRMLEITP